MKKFKWNLNSKQRIILGINGILLLAFLLVTIAANRKTDLLYSQNTASRWENEGESYAQVSAFFSPERNVQLDEVKGIRNSLMKKLSEDSYYNEDSSGRVLIDAYSGECETQIWREGNTLSVTAVGVGNDFFQFHPIPLLAGGYISGEDLNHDRVVLDENLAWAMFGSNDVVGMQIWMGNSIYVVAGVVAVDEDSLYKTAYGTGNRMYMSYEALKAQKEELKVTCYEAVMPNPISNYAFYALKSACGQDEMENSETMKEEEKNPLNFDSCEVIENSNRFESLILIENLAGNKYKSMRTNSVGYPFWENIARVITDWEIRMLFIRCLLLVFPLICAIVVLYRLWKHRTWTVGSLVVSSVDYIRERRAEKAEEKRRLEQQLEEDMDASEYEEEMYEDDSEAEDAFFQSKDWNEIEEENTDESEVEESGENS